MLGPFIQKLRAYASLSPEDINIVNTACAIPRDFSAGYDLIKESDKPSPLFVMCEGWACRYQILPDGTRQITAFLMPGDCCDIYASVLEKVDSSVATITPARVAAIPRADF